MHTYIHIYISIIRSSSSSSPLKKEEDDEEEEEKKREKRGIFISHTASWFLSLFLSLSLSSFFGGRGGGVTD